MGFSMIIGLLFLATIQQILAKPMCGSHQFFEYKFRPILIRPVKEADLANSKQRCGEKLCDIMVSFMGNTKCKKGKFGELMFAPKDKNEAAEFTPPVVGWKPYYQWSTGKDDDNKMRVEVCDKDPAIKFGNDQLIDFELRDMIEGCQTQERTDGHPTHPWRIQFEICCRPSVNH